jgi:hypothetical protein
MTLEYRAKAILREVNPRLAEFALNSFGGTREAVDNIARAISALEQQAEIDANLGPNVPQLSANSLHSWVWDSAKTLWSTEHFREAVQAATTSLNANLQAIADRRDVSDSQLAQELFSDRPPGPGKPRLRWPGDQSDQSVKSMQAALIGLSNGVFRGIRNIATHDLSELTEQEAFERLAAVSLLCHWVQQCELDHLG